MGDRTESPPKTLQINLDDSDVIEEPADLTKSPTVDPPHNSQDEEDETTTDNGPSLASPRKGKRRNSRVRFPAEGKMVRCKELPSPWDNAPATNKVEAVMAYRESCRALKVRPQTKVIQLLQNIDDFKPRYEALDLRNTKLDNRSCEALEAVFKRLQFVTVNLDSTALEDDGAMAIFEMLDFYDSANRLVLSRNPRLGGRAWLSCSRMMKKSNCITFLDVRECTFDDYTIPLIGRPIRANCVLKTLHIEGNDLSGRTHLILVAALKTNMTLTEIFLGNNKLVAEDMVHMGSILKINNTLELLDLRDNIIGDEGLRHLCEGLLEQEAGGLKSLVLWNNKLTAKSMNPLAVILPTHRTIETLNLGNNRIESTGCQTLKPGLLGNQSLKRLGMVNCKITCEGAIALAEVIGDNKPLQRIDLRENDIRIAGLLALSLAHRVSHNLVRLDMKKSIRSENRDQELIKKLFLDIEAYGQRNKIEVEEREAREAVLLRQKALEAEKKREEEAVEQERRSEALVALSTALHAQAMVEGHGLSKVPKEEMKGGSAEEAEEANNGNEGNGLSVNGLREEAAFAEDDGGLDVGGKEEEEQQEQQEQEEGESQDNDSETGQEVKTASEETQDGSTDVAPSNDGCHAELDGTLDDVGEQSNDGYHAELDCILDDDDEKLTEDVTSNGSGEDG